MLKLHKNKFNKNSIMNNNSFTYVGLILEKSGLIIKNPFIRISNINISSKVTYQIEKYLSEDKFIKFYPPYAKEILTFENFDNDYSNIFEKCLEDYRKKLKKDLSLYQIPKTPQKPLRVAQEQLPKIASIKIESSVKELKSLEIKPLEIKPLEEKSLYGSEPFVDTTQLKHKPFLRRKTLSINTF